MSEQTKKIVLPAFLLRRLEAFRIVKGEEPSYLLRDKVLGKTYDFSPWQFFILEVLPGCETVEKLQHSFQHRFDRVLTQQDLDEVLGSVADQKLFNETAAEHPLLVPYFRRSYEVVDGKAQPKSFVASAGAATPASLDVGTPATPPVVKASKAAASGAAAGASTGKVPPVAASAADRDDAAELPAGVQDALGLDWRTTKNMWGLFDPRPLLRLLGPVLRPLRHVVYAVPVLLLATFFLSYQYSALLVQDFATLKLQVSLFKHLLFVFITVHVVTTATAALVADAFKVSVDKVGLTLTFGFMPRWVLKMTGAERLSRRQTMWLHGSTLIARMVMLSAGVFIWYNARDTQPTLAEVGLLLVFSCGVGLLLESGNPLVKANCYYVLAAYLNEPHLRAKAFAALLNKMRGGVYRAADNNLLALYALLSATYIVLLIVGVGALLARFVLGELALGGSAIILTLGFVGYMLWRNYEGLKRFGETYERQVQFDRWRTRTLAVDATTGETGTRRTNYWKRALLLGLLLALFLPYHYESGGGFQIFPAQKQVISTDTAGLVEQVYFDGGEAVSQGTVIARLAHDDYLSQMKVLAAKINEQQAVINNLKTLPRPEEVRLAQQMLEVERGRESFSREKEPRMEKLYRVGAVSFEEYDIARKEHMTDLQQVAQKEAQLALVKAPVTTDQIAAAQAKLASLQEERASFEAKVERTVLKMPFNGNILTLHLKDKLNSYLEKGAPFAALENTGVVTAEIDIAESDVQYVRLGANVRARPVSFFDTTEFAGKVTVIDRNVTQKSTGNVVKVIATIDNPAGLLKTGMAGQAKIEGVDMPVWRAFSLAVVRFVEIQVWSWIP